MSLGSTTGVWPRTKLARESCALIRDLYSSKEMDELAFGRPRSVRLLSRKVVRMFFNFSKTRAEPSFGAMEYLV